MATTTSSIFSLPSLRTRTHSPTLLPCLQPKLTTLKLHRLAISCAKGKVSPVVISCLVEDNSKPYHEPEGSTDCIKSTPVASLFSWFLHGNLQGASIDLRLPRRSLLAHFTCNACGERSQKLINRLAYEKGTVFVQCTGCSQYHKLVDILNLVVEYDLWEG